MKEDSNKTAFQKLASSFVVLIGLSVFLSTTNTITGNVIGGTGNITLLEVIVSIWGLSVIIIGVWMWNYRKFHASIFD